MHYPRLSRRRFAELLVSLGFIAARPALAVTAAGGPFDVILESNLRVKMRDGVHLATDVYRPARDGVALRGRFPLLMERTPYGRNVTSFRDITAADVKPKTRAEVAAYYVRHGYVVVFQDCRGRNDSEGEFVKYLNEGMDGFDTCRWLLAQAWSDGSIGTMGLSYAAHTQVAMGCLNPPGLKAMYVDCGGFSNAFQGGIRQGGTFELKQVTWAYALGLESPEVMKDPRRLAALKAVDIKAWFASMPWKRGHTPLSLLPDYENYVYEQWEHGTFDAYWRRVGIYAAGYYDEFSEAAMVHVSGWYDPYARTATDNYLGLAQRKRGPVRLVMGPWTHGGRSTSHAGDVEFGPAATLDADMQADYFAVRLRWFDHHLKGVAADAAGDGTVAPVRLFVMGGGSGHRNAEGRLEHGGRWRSERTWPIPDAQPAIFYLSVSGTLSQALPARDAQGLSYDFDPRHPVPTMGGTVTSGEPLMRGGGYDQREGPDFYGSRQPYLPVDARPDVLVFQTEPLTVAIEVTGVIEAHLWVSSDCPDTDFTIKLIDVYPPSAHYPSGFALNLTDGILRCRYRDSWERPELMLPGQPYLIKVEAFPTANLFAAGHRIRLDVSSSNFPHFDVNPNTGDPEGKGLTRRVARNSVFVDAARASLLTLPIIPRRA